MKSGERERERFAFLIVSRFKPIHGVLLKRGKVGQRGTTVGAVPLFLKANCLLCIFIEARGTEGKEEEVWKAVR